LVESAVSTGADAGPAASGVVAVVEVFREFGVEQDGEAVAVRRPVAVRSAPS
jgi:hypothetical protein